jgi:hypothetical protein
LTQILLHRAFILSPFQISSGGEQLPSSHTLCTQAADHIVDLIRQLKGNFGLRKVTTTGHLCARSTARGTLSPCGSGLFSAATIFIANTTSVNEDFAAESVKRYEEVPRFS